MSSGTAVLIGCLTFLTPIAHSAKAASPNPAPMIYAPLAPDVAVPGSPAFTITVSGTGFTASSVVNWNGSARATSFVTSSRLTATIAASDVASAGTATVTVVTPGPGGGTSNAVYFPITTFTNTVALGEVYDEGGYPAASPNSVAVGDFNGDGKLDMAVASTFESVFIVSLGNGDGTFQATRYQLGTAPSAVVTGDFNGDGKLDLAIPGGILFGNGDGTFQGLQSLPPPPSQYQYGTVKAIVAGDFNGDGILDLAVTNYWQYASPPYSVVLIYLGAGGGAFNPATAYATKNSASALATGDFNGDGKLDLVTGETLGNAVSVLLGNGDGTFQNAVSYTAGVPGFDNQGGPSSIALGDFNGDGKLDLVTACSYPGTINCSSVLLGNGDGTFQPAMNYGPSGASYSVAVGDFNGDGKLDAATAGYILMQAPTLSLSADNLAFRNRLLNTRSAPRTVTLTNTGYLPLDIGGMMLQYQGSSDYIETNTCSAVLPIGASCTISLRFAPIAIGPQPAWLNISDNSVTGPERINLNGVGVIRGADATVRPTHVNFRKVQPVGTSSRPSPVALHNYGTATFTDNAAGSPQNVALSGAASAH